MPSFNAALLVALPLLGSVAQAQYTATYYEGSLPTHTEDGQQGINNCGTTNSQDSMCQTAVLNSLSDFCLWAPPAPGVTIGNSEEYEVAWCTTEGHGTRTIPEGTIIGAHYLETPHYTQITGYGNLVNLNIAAGDEGGELDPHGATGNGNPIGGIVFANGQQIHEWTSFMSDNEFCFRICKPAPDAWEWCQHIYDIQGCHWNEPGNYDAGFDSCEGDSTEQPPGVYIVDGQSSTYQQSQGAAPSAHAAGASSNCQAVASLGAPITAKAVTTTTSAPASSSTVESSVSSSNSSTLASSTETSTLVSSSTVSSSASSSMITSTSTSIIFSTSSILPNTSTVASSTATSSTSAAVVTILSTASASTPSSSSSALTAGNNRAAASNTPASGAGKLAMSVGGSLVAVGLGLMLFA